MDTVKSWLKKEFINGQRPFDWIFMGIGLIIQAIAIFYQFAHPEGMTTSQLIWTSISSVCGVISVIWFAQRKISAYIISFIQLFTYVFAVAIPSHLWGEVAENGFYFVTMIIGIVLWAKNYNTAYKEKENRVNTKKLSIEGWFLSLITFCAGTLIFYYILSCTNDPFPFLDSITTISPFIAQILLTFRYSDQWCFWILEDIASVVMFSLIGNWIMAAQYVFWTLNCIYGWYKWEEGNE